MAQAVVSFTVERLGDLLISEAKFLSRVSDQVNEIRVELQKIQRYLQDADAKQYENQTIRNWVREIRQLSHNTEDILETFVVKAASQGGCGIKKTLRRFACFFCEAMALHRIGLELGAINAKMSTITRDLQACKEIKALHEGEITSFSNSEKLQSMRISYSLLTKDDFDFVGMEEEIKELVLLLKKKEKGCEVLSIWGMGGQGKTTLARKLYNHDQVRSTFRAFAWVCISQRYQKEKVLQDILIQLRPDQKGEIKKMGDKELVQELHQTQQESCCLIIIDDIWTLAAWESLELAFPIEDKASGSKIMLTTRLEQVAKVGRPYKLRPFSEEEGWKLLLKKAFPKGKHDTPENQVDTEKEKIGREMVQKCKGLPLAISALGGIVKDKTLLKDWQMLNKDVASYVSRGEGGDNEYGAVRQVLALSYDDLPSNLKHMFLYLGNFLEDSEIWAVNLYFMWMAEGLLFANDRTKGEMMLDVAERHLGELAQRSLVQVQPTLEGESYLHFRSCHIHDLIRDLCLWKGKEEEFVEVIDSQNGQDTTLHFNSLVESNMAHSRRLAIILSDGSDIQLAPLRQQNVIRQLRSLIFFNPNRLPAVVTNLKEFKLLRILRLEKFRFSNGKLLAGIGELTYLRYLNFYDCIIDELPASIGNLRYLQTLDLQVRSKMIIPHNILHKMKQLQHLYLPIFICLRQGKKLRFDGAEELTVISKFNVRTCDINDLVKLRSVPVLRAVTVHSLQDIMEIIHFVTSEVNKKRYLSLWCVNISNFGSEEGLSCLIQVLECNILNNLFIDGYLGILPKNYNRHLFSEKLTSIHLWFCEFEEDPMELLEQLPNLRVLRLNPHSYVGKEMVCAAMGFPQLMTLELNQLVNLEMWSVDEGAMPNLSQLEISCCSKLVMLPDGLRFLTALRILYLDYMPQEFQNRVKVVNGVEGEDYDKVRHIPCITF